MVEPLMKSGLIMIDFHAAEYVYSDIKASALCHRSELLQCANCSSGSKSSGRIEEVREKDTTGRGAASFISSPTSQRRIRREVLLGCFTFVWVILVKFTSYVHTPLSTNLQALGCRHSLERASQLPSLLI